jgi:hypothetical protein
VATGKAACEAECNQKFGHQLSICSRSAENIAPSTKYITIQSVPHREHSASPWQRQTGCYGVRQQPLIIVRTIWNTQIQKTNSVALSPRANYTDWATATCRRNLVPTFVDRGVSRGQRGGSPTVVKHTDTLPYNIEFSPYFTGSTVSLRDKDKPVAML